MFTHTLHYVIRWDHSQTNS